MVMGEGGHAVLCVVMKRPWSLFLTTGAMPNLIICEMCSEVCIVPFYFWIRTYLFEEYAGTSSVAAQLGLGEGEWE